MEAQMTGGQNDPRLILQEQMSWRRFPTRSAWYDKEKCAYAHVQKQNSGRWMVWTHRGEKRLFDANGDDFCDRGKGCDAVEAEGCLTDGEIDAIRRARK